MTHDDRACTGCGYRLNPDTGLCFEAACQRYVCAKDHPGDVCTACEDWKTAAAIEVTP